MWQEIAIIIVGFCVIGYVGYKIYHFFTRPKQDNLCAGCPGCSLSREMDKKDKEDCEKAINKRRNR